jgi:hypothetical protein
MPADGTTLLEGQPAAAAGAAAAGTTATAPAAGTAAAGAATTPEFKAADAIAFLTEHGADPKSLEGVAEADLKTRFESAKTIAGKAAEKAKPKGLDKYDFRAPEGVKLDELSTELSAVAKELGLPQEGAQKVFDLGVKVAQKFAKNLETNTTAMQEQWLKDTRADKEFGGDKLEENVAIAQKARDAFASPELRTLLNDSKLGNHPEMIRLFFRMGKAMKEDKTVNGGESGQSTSMESRLYGKTTG